MKKLRAVARKTLKITGLYSSFLKLNNILNSNTKENPELIVVSEIYKQFVKKGDVCFDVGANMGLMTTVLLDLGVRVIAVEPQSSCVHVLKKKFYDDERVIIVDRALGDTKGKAEISICEFAPTISTMSDKWKDEGRFSDDYEWEKKQEVEVITLDDLIEKYGVPRFCKIDVEGFEPQVLKGLSKKIPYISFEFTKEFLGDAKTCMNHILTIGPAMFSCALHGSKNLKWVSSEELILKLENENNPVLSGDIYVKMD